MDDMPRKLIQDRIDAAKGELPVAEDSCFTLMEHLGEGLLERVAKVKKLKREIKTLEESIND